MAKSTATKKAAPKKSAAEKGTDSNVAFSKKNNPASVFSTMNPSRYAPTAGMRTDVQTMTAGDAMKELFYDGLKGMYWSELHLVDALPKMIAAASSKGLRTAIENHLAETETHVQKLEQVFQMAGEVPKAKKCAAMEGLTMDGEAGIEQTDAGSAGRDLVIIMSGDKVEHHEIAAYTGLVTLADRLGMTDASELLQTILDEEQASSELLNTIAAEDKAISDAFNEAAAE